MINFLKRNLKFVVVTSVAFLIIAGLSTALILTNIGHGSRGRDRNRHPDRIMQIDDQGAAYERRAERRERGGRTERNEQRERGERGERSERGEHGERKSPVEKPDIIDTDTDINDN